MSNRNLSEKNNCNGCQRYTNELKTSLDCETCPLAAGSDWKKSSKHTCQGIIKFIFNGKEKIAHLDEREPTSNKHAYLHLTVFEEEEQHTALIHTSEIRSNVYELGLRR